MRILTQSRSTASVDLDVDPDTGAMGGGTRVRASEPNAPRTTSAPFHRPSHPSWIAGSFARAVAGALIAVSLVSGGVRAHASPRTAQTSGAAAAVLAPDATVLVDRALDYAAKTPRSSARNGAAPIIGARELAVARRTWSALDGPPRQAVADAVAGARSDAEAALIVKAMASRSAELASADPLIRSSAAGEISAFADAIRGTEPAKLMQSTALIDIDETTDSSAFDPLTLDDPADQPLGASQKDNDGLFQRYEDSCGPTSIEVLLGDLDPMYALRVRTSDITVNPPGTDFQKEVLLRYGEDPSSRLFPYYEKKTEALIAAVEKSGAITGADARSLEAYLFAGKPKPASFDRSLEALRSAGAGFPSEGVVRTLVTNTPKDPAKQYGRIGLENIRKLLNEKVGARLGVEYQIKSIYQGVDHRMKDDEIERASPAFVNAHLDALARTLGSGVGVMFSTTWPDHFWSMTAVTGDVGHREFLVHDVWSGRTRWVTQAALADGSFAKQFLGEKKIYTKVDLIYLPSD